MKNPLKQLINSNKFYWVNSNIEKNFKLEEVRNTDYKLFHFDKYVSSKYAIKEIENEGYCPANLAELLNWKDWNNKDWVVALGSVTEIGGGRRVAYLFRVDSGCDLDLGWFDGDWVGGCRFLGVKSISESKRVEIEGFDESFISRFWSQVDKTDNCWNWIGAKHEQGYGLIKSGETSLRAHRISVLMSGREIPDGCNVDHLCKNTSCVNPDHLEVVTPKENTLRGEGITAKNAKKTHCVHGHEFTEESTKVRKNDDGSISRVCLMCQRSRNSTLKPSEISSGPLTLKSAISLCKKEGYQVSKIM